MIFVDHDPATCPQCEEDRRWHEAMNRLSVDLVKTVTSKLDKRLMREYEAEQRRPKVLVLADKMPEAT
jgi:hypothetical protein